jgi:hypothetical protein
VDVRRWRIAAAVAGVTVLAAALRFSGLRFGLPPTMGRPDEEAITTIAAGIVLRGPNPKFFDYPTLFIYIVAFVEKLWPGGRAVLDDTLPTMISRSIAAALGTLSVPLVLLIARRLFSVRAALVSSALLAVAFLHVRDSHFGVTDIPMTFMVLLALWLVVSRPLDSRHWWNVVLAAVACGLATSTKYNAAPVVAPLLIGVFRANGRRWPMYLIAIGAVAAGFFIGTPYALITRGKFIADVLGLQSHLASGHATDEGLGWMRHLTFSLNYGLGLPFLVAALAGALWMIVRDRWPAAVALSFPLLYYLAMGSGRTVFMRHATPVVPFAAVTAGYAIDRVVSWLPRPAAGAAWQSVAAAILVVLVGADSLQRSVALDRLLQQTDSRTLASAFVKARYPRGASVYQNGAVYGQVPLVPEGIYPSVPLERAPLLVIVQRSRLVAYSGEPSDLRATLDERYHLLDRIEVESNDGRSEPIFDQQDAFFVPVTGFDRMIRPGPSIEIYERRPES